MRQRLALVATAVVALIVGAVIGSAGSNNSQQLNRTRGQLVTAEGKVSGLSAQNSTLQGQVRQAQEQARGAMAAAEKALAAKSAQVLSQAHANANQIIGQANSIKSQASAQLNAASHAAAQLKAEQNTFVGNTIPGDGLFQVGKDIQAGTYHSSGPSTSGGGNCYWARLASSDTQNIIDNNNEQGPTTIVIQPSDAFFETTGCQPWTPAG